MIKVSETEAKVTSRKKNIAVKDVMIEDGMLTDDDGTDILSEIQNALPDGVEKFSFKISVEIPDDMLLD